MARGNELTVSIQDENGVTRTAYLNSEADAEYVTALFCDWPTWGIKAVISGLVDLLSLDPDTLAETAKQTAAWRQDQD